MFCPKCGQQQISEESSFCSRCGFRLTAVRQSLGTDGVIEACPAVSALPVIVSLSMFIGTLLALGASLIYVGPASDQMVMFALIAAAITFIFLLSCRPWRVIGKWISQDPAGQIKEINLRGSQSTLPPAQNIPIGGFSAQRVRTAEIIQPPSITEHTTKLLDTESPP